MLLADRMRVWRSVVHDNLRIFDQMGWGLDFRVLLFWWSYNAVVYFVDLSRLRHSGGTSQNFMAGAKVHKTINRDQHGRGTYIATQLTNITKTQFGFVRSLIISLNLTNLSKIYLQRPDQMPFKAILTSGPVWAIAIIEFCHGWGLYTLLIELPTYFKTVLDFSMENVWEACNVYEE